MSLILQQLINKRWHQITNNLTLFHDPCYLSYFFWLEHIFTVTSLPYSSKNISHCKHTERYPKFISSINHVKNTGNASVMGQRNGLSDKDVQKLKSMYKCKTTGAGTSTTSGNRPLRPNSPTNQNRPVLNFLGNLVSGFFQEEKAVDGPLSNATEITNSIE